MLIGLSPPKREPARIITWSPITALTTDDAEPIRQFLPMRTSGPITAIAPTTVPDPISARGPIMAAGSMVTFGSTRADGWIVALPAFPWISNKEDGRDAFGYSAFAT